MSFKKSSSNTEKNKETWTNNLVQFQAPSRRGKVAIYEAPLSERSRMPLKNHVIGRFKFLESTAKERRKRIGLIAVELKALWSKTLKFPHVSDQAICAKLANLLKDYEPCRKKQNFDSLNELFDVTKVKGEWMCKEDENAASTSIRKHNPTGMARRLVTSSKLSSHGAAKVCRQLSGEGIEIPTPSQSAIHKAIYTRAAQVKKHLVSTLHLEKWRIHFD